MFYTDFLKLREELINLVILFQIYLEQLVIKGVILSKKKANVMSMSAMSEHKFRFST